MYLTLTSQGNVFRPTVRSPFTAVIRELHFPINRIIAGVTKDNGGAALGACLCFLFKDNGDGTASFMDSETSDGSGHYAFGVIYDTSANYFVVSFKDSATHVFDVTDHVLQPV